MGIFSISPAVTYSENDLSGYTPQNLPSAKTGFVVRSETGECNKIVPFTSESDLLSIVGKPTAANYMDWFNAWNFCQYASSGYLVRPMNTSVKNAGLEITGTAINTTAKGNLYNREVAELELQEDLTNTRIAFYNKYVTPTQKLGISVCSGTRYWECPIANEFVGVVSRDGSDIKTFNNIGGSNLGLGEINMVGNITLQAGSKFIANGNKLVTVKNVYSDKILTNSALTQGDISLFYGTVRTAAMAVLPATNTVVLQFDATKRFNITKNTIFNVTKGTGNDTLTIVYYVSAIGSEVAGAIPVTLTKINSVDGSGTPPANVDILAEEITSNSEYYHFVPSSDYLDETTFIIPAGTTTIKVEPNFNFPVGSFAKFAKTGDIYTNLATDVFPEETVSDTDTYEIVAIDTLNNTITLDRGLELDAEIASTTVLDDIVTIASAIRGINLYSTIYDDSVIIKTPISATDIETLEVVSMYKEQLVSFDQLFMYEPSFVDDEFVVVILEKNTLGKYNIVEKKLASYRSTGRDYSNKNLFANEVFFYGSDYVYCKVNENEELRKAETAPGPLGKFISDLGTGTAQNYVYGTVYPLAKDSNGIKIDLVTGKASYDANAYTIGDIQFAAQQFSDGDSFDINILVAHELDLNVMSTISETRKDCITIVAPYDYKSLVGKSATTATQNLLNDFGSRTPYANKKFGTFGTYSAIYGNMKYQYDKFNDVNRWVCIAGDVAGIYAQTDYNRDPWYAPAGIERGKIKNTIKLAVNTQNKANKDALYINSINLVIPITGEGEAIVFGQRTATAKPTALDRVNVRRLMITLEKAISTAVKYGLFEFNDSFTRARLVGIIDPYMRTVKARRGVYEYSVVCDLTNNTPSVIDNNGLIIDVWVQPTKVAESIHINFNILNQSTSISEAITQNTI